MCAQNYNENIYQSNHTISTDAQNMETNFVCLKSAFSGVSSPANATTGMPWYDTSKKLQKFRNYSNNAWLCNLPLDTTQRIWIYRNDAVYGMVVDTTLTDRVVAVAGESGTYFVTAGNTAGGWDFTHTHGPGSFSANLSHRHYGGATGGTFGDDTYSFGRNTDYAGSTAQAVTGTSASTTDTTWRPSAAVGTLQKIDV